MWVYVICGLLGVLLLLLFIKMIWMRKSIQEISERFSESCENDTNVLIDVSSRDGRIRNLAGKMNEELRIFHKERHRFREGDRELKEAIANISHDLRTPLTAISGYLELLKEEPKSEEAAKYLEVIKNRTEVMKKLTEELFRYSVIASVEDEKTELLSLNEVLEESLAGAYAIMKEKKIIPKITMPKERVERQVNRSALIRIFGNIISNAVKYSDGDFEVEMKENGEIVFSNMASELTPITAGRLFDRFYTVETGRNSTGLGLSIAKILTERMGGSIRAIYEEGKLRIILFL